MRVEFINPFLTATQDVFDTMLGTKLTRGSVVLKSGYVPTHEVSGLIGLSGMGGQCTGMVVVSIGRSTAIQAAGIMLGTEPQELDADVMDAVGELTNMIAGAAKTKLEEYRFSIGLPTVICGKNHSISFPSETSPIVIPFESELGPICVEVGMVEVPQPAGV